MSQDSQSSRRRFLQGAVFGGGAIILAACGSAPATGTTGTAATSAAGTTGGAASATSSGSSAATGASTLNVLWAQWDPANYLQQLVKDYPGATVTVVQEPWGSFGDRFFTEMASKGQAYDMVVGDSQWLGQGSSQGHYVDLSSMMDTKLNGKSLSPPTIKYYGEYPSGSGKVWAYPLEGDACGWAYRKDLFEDPTEMSNFKAKYGYDLAVPKDYKQLHDIAEFFTRPDKNLYGNAIYTQKDYDGLTMGFEATLFSYGGDWGDYSTGKVDGVLNSPVAVEALTMYKSLYAFVPPGSSNDFYQETNNHFTSGQVAMAMNFFAFFPALANKASNPFADKTGYFANPAGPTGKRFAPLGGQGISIVSYISDDKKKAAEEFLAWLAKDDTQQKWADLGGYTCNANVLKSDAFLKATPYNQAFADSMAMVKDFWAVPVYGEMMQKGQQALHQFIVEGQGDAKGTLDKIAKEHEDILKKGGILK